MKYIVDLDDLSPLDAIRSICKVLDVNEYHLSVVVDIENEEQINRLKEIEKVLSVLPNEKVGEFYLVQPINKAEHDYWPLATISLSEDSFKTATLGENVDIVIQDSGLNLFHEEFNNPPTYAKPPYNGKYIHNDFFWGYTSYKNEYFNEYEWFRGESYITEDGYFQFAINSLGDKYRVPITQITTESTSTDDLFYVYIDTTSSTWQYWSSELHKFYRFFVYIETNWPLYRGTELTTFLSRANFGGYKRLYYAVDLIGNVYGNYILVSFAKGTFSGWPEWGSEHNGYIVFPLYIEQTSSVTEHNKRGFTINVTVPYNPRKAILPFVFNSSQYNPVHGVAVSSCAGGKNAGIAKKACLVGSHTSLTTDSLAQSFDEILKYHQFKLANGIKRPTVMNMSWGGALNDPFRNFVKDSVNWLASNGIIIVCAAGNRASRVVREGDAFPAGFSETITVGATNINNNLAYFSCYGSGVDLYAPGHRSKMALMRVAIPHRMSNEQEETCATLAERVNNFVDAQKYLYMSMSGTSFASPYTAGVVACVLNALGNPVFTNLQQVLEFKQFFLEECTWLNSSMKYNIYNKQLLSSFNSDVHDNPANWVVGFPPDDKNDGDPGSTPRLLYLPLKIYMKDKTWQRREFDIVEGLKILLDYAEIQINPNEPARLIVQNTPQQYISSRSIFFVNGKKYRLVL